MRYALWGLLGPVSWPLWLLAVGTIALFLHRRRLAKWSLTAGSLLFLALGLLPSGRWLMAALEADYPPREPPASVDHIVVLAGGEELPVSAISGRLEIGAAGDRVLAGAALARRYPRAALHIVGHGPGPRQPADDTQLTAHAWRDLGVEPGRLRTIGGTADTCENAKGVADHDLEGTILLVTSAFHMPRAEACFQAAGVDAVPYPVDFRIGKASAVPDIAGNLDLVDYALHEWMGLAYYRLADRID